MRVTLIAAVARNGVIGRDGALPWQLPDDLARFKRLTVGKPIVMGRKTYESIGRPLRDRLNIVLSTRGGEIPGCVVATTIDEAIEAAGDAPELCVIGGEAVYEAFLDRADRMELTEIDADVEGDAYFPAFDRDEWTIAREDPHEVDDRHSLAFRFVTYERPIRDHSRV